MLQRLTTLLCAAALAATAGAQHQRVTLNGTPTNLLADWSNVFFLTSSVGPNGFHVILPLAEVRGGSGGPFVFEGDARMDALYGAGAWSRCTMRAEEWWYLSSDRCLHRPAPGAAAPESLLTTDFDYGTYTGIGGRRATIYYWWMSFRGLSDPQAVISGARVGGLGPAANERWQLRVHGSSPSNSWNACPGGAPTPTAPGWIAVYFTFAFS